MSKIVGLRTQESQKFVNYFQLVQEFANRQGCVFFFDTGDGRDFEIDDFEGEDLMGWIVPQNLVDAFEKEWSNWNVLDDWSEYYCWAIWYKQESLLKIKFERY